MRILIHNHGLAYKGEDGIWIQAYLGYCAATEAVRTI